MYQAELDLKVRARLELYVSKLNKWKGVTNLISESAFEEIWRRHIPDGVRLYRLFPDKLRWLDFGSGAGLPSVIIGSLLAGQPNACVFCVESDGRKCSFLRTVARDLQIPLKILNTRVENLDVHSLGTIEIVTARAFASIGKITSLAVPFLARGATLILPRGESSRSDIEDLDPIRYEVIEHEGLQRGNGFFLQIRQRLGKD